jgi:hypothetical protein
MEIATTKKRRVETNLCRSECTENPGKGYKRSRLAKSLCIGPQSYKTVFLNMVEKSQLIDSILSSISLF